MCDIPTVMVVDESEIFRNSISNFIEEEQCGFVLATAADGYTAIKKCRLYEPDIVLLDLEVSRPSGEDTLKRILSANPATRIIIYSSTLDAQKICTLIAEGAIGFVWKNGKRSEFINAVHAATLQCVCIPQEFISELIPVHRDLSDIVASYGLSSREIEILGACVAGEESKAIAGRLGISVRTVEAHRQSIYRKTSCHCVKDLTNIFLRARMH